MRVLLADGAQLLFLGEGYVELVLRFRQGSLIGSDLRFSLFVLGLRVIQLLLGDEPGTRLRGFL